MDNTTEISWLSDCMEAIDQEQDRLNDKWDKLSEKRAKLVAQDLMTKVEKKVSGRA